MTWLSSRRRHPLAAPVVLLLLLLAFGGAYAVISTAGSAQAAPAQSPQEEEGRALFLEGCSSCHGVAAQGGTDGPSLVGVGAAAVDFQVGTGRMPLAARGAQAERAPVTYTRAEIDQLAAYIASLGPGPEVPPAEEYEPVRDEELIKEGGELFRTNCASCHNFAAQGGALTQGKYAPRLVGVEPRYVYEAMLTGPQSMPIFADTTLTPEEKKAIISWLAAIENQADPGGAALGRIGPVSEGLVAWVVGIGALVLAAVWIGAKAS